MPERRFDFPDGRFAIIVRQRSDTHRTTLHLLDGEEQIATRHCVHVVIEGHLEQLAQAESVDDLLSTTESKLGQEPARKQGIILDRDLFWAHCSNIQYWIEAGLPPEGLAANLSVPLLYAIALRDPKYASILAFHVEDLIERADPVRLPVIIERYGQLMPVEWWESHTELLPHLSIESTIYLARDPRAPPALLNILSAHKNPDVRGAVASNHIIPPEIAGRLSKDTSMSVRCTLAGNPTTPATILQDFAEYRHILMRTVCARNPSTPLLALRHLYITSGFQIRRQVIENPAVTANFLNGLLEIETFHATRDLLEHKLASLGGDARIRG